MDREDSFRLLFESNPIPMWVYDLDSLSFLAVNDAALEHYGYSREQFISMSILDIRPVEDRNAVRAVAGTREGNYHTGRTWRHIKADGSQIEVAIYSQSLRYAQRDASLVAAIDITERKRAEDELRSTRTFLNTVVENMPAMLFVKEARENRFVLINRAGEELLGLSRDEMIGKNDYDFFPKEEADFFVARDREVLRSGHLQIIEEEPIHTRHKGVRLLTTKKLAIFDDRGEPQYLVGVSEDITERKRAEERIAYMAHHDALTGLPNRVLFRERLEQGLASGHRDDKGLAVLCMDLDSFKAVNDTLGHPSGDAVLRSLAERVLACIRDFDTVARLDGDEFAIVQIGAKPNDASTLAQRVLDVVSQPYDLEGRRVVVGTSIGIAMGPSDGDKPDQLLKNADMALYRAKADGGGTYRFFEREMDARLQARRALELDLRNALLNGEFELFYQPVIGLEDNRIRSAEALLRWRHCERGMISPAEFIPLAEEIGVIVPIGDWVLRQACAEVVTWPGKIKVAVNLSPAQFKRGNLVQGVVNALAASGLPASRLELEITESLLLQENESTLDTLRQLKALGVGISLDDFGTGHSSLSYLRRYPFDKIKIDQSFVRELSSDAGCVAIVRAIVSLGSGLGMATTAEGVETEEQLRLLRDLGCNEVQGYLFSRPKPAKDIVELLAHQSDAIGTAA